MKTDKTKRSKGNQANPGKKIKELRQAAGMGQASLARELGLTQASISQFEQGIRNPHPDTLDTLAGIFECSVEDISGEPSAYDQLVQNCKRLSRAQCEALNEVVLQLVKRDRTAEKKRKKR